MADDILGALTEANSETEGTVLFINPEDRTISIPSGFVFGVYNDKDVLTIPFSIPRYYRDIDLSDFRFTINYLNAAGYGNIFDVTDLEVGEDTITFTWTLGRAVFVSRGSVRFIVCIRRIGSNGRILQELNTQIYSAEVLAGLEVEENPDPEAYSILANMIQLESSVAASSSFVADKASQVSNIVEGANRALESANAKLDEAIDAIGRAEQLYGSPLVAATASAMTDTTRVYVYTGSETGYTTGNWYYWDGTAWVSGGVYNASTEDIDADLSDIEESIADLEEAVSGIQESISDLEEATTSIGETISDIQESISDLEEADSGIEEALSELEESKANVNGNYADMTVGTAEQLTSTVGVEDNSPYIFRASPAVGDRAQMKAIVGGSVAWNQLATPGAYISSGATVSGITITHESGAITATLNGTKPADGNYAQVYAKENIAAINNHVYLIITPELPNLTSNQYYTYAFGPTSVTGYVQGHGYGIAKAISTGTAYLYGRIYIANAVGSYTFTNFKIGYNLIDLTLAFGSTIADYLYTLESGTAGAGIAKLKSWGFLTKDYYAYNAGGLESVQTSGRVVRGFNVWDEVWEVGRINGSTGALVSGNGIRSKNYIPVFSNTSYYVKGASNLIVCQYDEDKNFISTIIWGDQNKSVLTNANARYLLVGTFDTYGNTYKNDICINIHRDGERDGEYEPHTERTYSLDPVVLRGIPELDANDNLYYDGDRYEPDGKVKRLVKETKVTNAVVSSPYRNAQGIWCASFTDYPIISSGVECARLSVICDKIPTTSQTYTQLTNNAIVPPGNPSYIGVLGLNDATSGLNANSTDVEVINAFRNYLNTLQPTVVYRIVNPTTETAEPYVANQWTDPYGAEEFIDAGERDVAVPVGHKTLYMADLKGKLEKAPDAPSSDGDYILRRADGVNTYTPYTPSGMNVVTLSGTTVTQTGAANTMYMCGTLTELTFTAPSSGICGVMFSSGSTPTVLTITGVTYWMNEFDPTSIEASKTYEISILNGVGVASC